MNMKHEWKKHEKALYGAKTAPSLVEVPRQRYLTISGKGNPNDTAFSDRVGVLYALAYAIKMGYKAMASKTEALEGMHDFSVYPLEGVWKKQEGIRLVKEDLEYTVMIRQPDCIAEPMVQQAVAAVSKKKPSPLLREVGFEALQDGLCVEILHIGSYDDEPASFEKMDEFAKCNGLKRIGDYHREIYLNNAKRVLTSKLQTILRYPVQR